MTVETAANKLTKAAQQVDSLVEDASDVANGVANRAMSAMREAGAAAESLYDQGSEAGDYVLRMVSNNPLPALLVAGAVGYVIASLARRR